MLLSRLTHLFFPKSHDIRKYATSLAFFSGMSFQQIQANTGWKGYKVFLSHYKQDLCVLRQSCVAIGNVVHPLPDAADLQLNVGV